MSKAILIIDMPDNCYECPLENTRRCPFLWEDVESLDKPKDCPLKPYKEVIPIEWIRKWRKDKWFSNEPLEKRMIMAMGVRLMLEDWEAENETNK